MGFERRTMTKHREDIILASASPRRKEMFEERGIPVEIFPSNAEENLPISMDPETATMYLALSKAMDVASKRQGLIIAADTVVVFGGEIIGKPKDREEAFNVLSSLRGNSHTVVTGVCVIDNAAGNDRDEPDSSPIKRCLYDVSRVYFTEFSDEELEAYVNTDEPYDKAGGYAIQQTFGRYIDRVDGDIDNVIGFPMYRVEGLLKKLWKG